MFKPTKCPNCGGKLQFPENQKIFRCLYCGGEFLAENPLSPVAETAKSAAPKEENFNTAQLKITFPGVWVVVDLDVRVFFDNQLLGIGSVKNGFEFTVPTLSGRHSVDLKTSARDKNYTFEIPFGGSFQLQIEYSRTWGNFGGEVNLIRLG